MDVDRQRALSRFPHVFTDRCRRPAWIVPLTDDRLPALIAMYLTRVPRDSFQGLPPLRDDACVRWVRETLANGISLVALAPADCAIGHAALFPLSADRCEILVVVSPDQQNSGIGTELLCCGLQLARDLGLDRVWLEVDAANARARHLYRKCGFCYRSTNYRDELEMALDLSNWPGEVLVGRLPGSEA